MEARLTSVVHNLVTLMLFPGTYLDRFEVENRDWEAAIEIQNSLGTTLIDNAVAGSEKLGFANKLSALYCYCKYPLVQ